MNEILDLSRNKETDDALNELHDAISDLDTLYRNLTNEEHKKLVSKVMTSLAAATFLLEDN